MATVDEVRSSLDQQTDGGGGVEENPEFTCCYHAPEDPRVCVCGRNKASCGRKECVANLGTTGGKIICFLILATVITVAIVAQVLKPDDVAAEAEGARG